MSWRRFKKKSSQFKTPPLPPVILNPQFIGIEEQASERLYGTTSKVFNITAPVGTDGAIFVALVQKKNTGAEVSQITINGGDIVGANTSVSSNPLNRENQLAVFQYKGMPEGASIVSVANDDGVEGVSLIAVYYKNFTGLSGNFSSDRATGVQPKELIVGDAQKAVTAGNRGITVVFAGGLDHLVSEIPSPPYNEGVSEFGTTDVGDSQFNGKLKTAVDLQMSGNTTDNRWKINWDQENVPAEVLTLFGEVINE